MDISIKRVTDYINWHRTSWVRLDREYRAPLFELFALLTPMRATGVQKVRVGAGRDGGYVMLDDWKGIDGAFSLGIGPDVSWDYDIAQKGIPVWQYDHTIEAVPGAHPLFNFQQKKIVLQKNGDGEVALASLLGDVASKQTILKVDIDGDEWDLFSQLGPGLLQNCASLLWRCMTFSPSKIRNGKKKPGRLSPSWRATWSRPRPWQQPLQAHSPGRALPPRFPGGDLCQPALLPSEPTDETFPGIHDRKNNRYFPDFNLGRFQFGNSDKA